MMLPSTTLASYWNLSRVHSWAVSPVLQLPAWRSPETSLNLQAWISTTCFSSEFILSSFQQMCWQHNVLEVEQSALGIKHALSWFPFTFNCFSIKRPNRTRQEKWHSPSSQSGADSTREEVLNLPSFAWSQPWHVTRRLHKTCWWHSLKTVLSTHFFSFL